MIVLTLLSFRTSIVADVVFDCTMPSEKTGNSALMISFSCLPPTENVKPFFCTPGSVRSGRNDV